MLYIASAFSLSMLQELPATVKVQEITPESARLLMYSEEWESCVGHEGTARVLSEILATEIRANRKAVKLAEGDGLIVFQLMQRLPEGKVLSEEEVREVVKSGNWRLLLVTIRGE